MNTSYFPVVFRRQLCFWTFHCTLNALPSLGIALYYLKLWRYLPAIAAMFAAVATFVILYAALTSLSGPFANKDHLLSRSLKLGAKIRAWISSLSMLVVFTPAAALSPDLWGGGLAISLLNEAGRFLTGKNEIIFSPETGEGMWFNSAFFPVYVTTILQGLILSFLLLMISFFAVIFIQARDRRNFFAVADSR